MTNALLLRRRGMMQTQQGGLPYDAEVEYLRTTGTQYINTLLTLTADTTNIGCEFQCKINTLGPPSKLYVHSIPNGGFQVFTNNNNFYNQNATMPVTTSTVYTIIATSSDSDRSISVNGNTQTLSFNRSVKDGNPILILGTSNTAYPCSYADFYYFKLLRNGVLIFDGIPVRVGTVGYMYDRVSGQLFGNAGTGSFVLGPDII